MADEQMSGSAQQATSRAATTATAPAGGVGAGSVGVGSGGVGSGATGARASGKPGTPDKGGYSDPTNVSLPLSAVMGLGIAVLFYIVVFGLKGTTFGRGFAALWTERTWVVYVTAFMTSWAFAILMLKYKKLARQKEVLNADLIPATLPKTIDLKSVESYRKHFNALEFKPGETFLVDRLRRGIEHFRSRGNVQEASNLLTVQGDLDAAAVTSSYTMLNVLSWAIPILGFIGTVYGIGKSVGGFAQALEAASDLSLIKDSLKEVTSGLSVAFDTTLLALILSLLVVFPARGMQKAEEGVLSATDDFCAEQFISRLDDGGGPQEDRSIQMIKEAVQAALPSKDWVRESVAAAMAAQEAEFKGWTQSLREAGASMREEAVQGWQQISAELRTSQGAQVEEIKGMLGALGTDRQEFMEQVQASQDAQVQQLNQTVASMGELASGVGKQVAELQQTQLKSFDDVVGKLSGDLRSIQEANQKQAAEGAASLQQMADAFMNQLGQMQQEATTAQAGWAKQAEEFGTAITQRVVEGWDSINERLRDSVGQQVQDIQIVLNTLASERQEFIEQVKGVQASQVEQLGRTIETMEQSAARVQSQMSEMQEQQARSMQESVATISADLQKLQEQTSVAQAESSKHFEAISAAVTQQVVDGWGKIDQQLRERTESETRELANVVKAMEETAGRIQQQIGELQESQVRGMRESVSGLSDDLRSVREQQMQQARADGENLQKMVTTFSESLRDLREQVTATQREMSENLKGSGSAVRDELRQLTGELGEAFRSQMSSLDQVRRSVEDSANKFATQMEQMRSSHAEGLKEAVETLREGARTTQQEFSSSQTEAARKLQEVVSAMSGQANEIQRNMDGTREAMTEMAKQMAQQAEQARAAMEKAAQTQLSEMGSTSERMIASLADGLKDIQKKVGDMETSQQKAAGDQVNAMREEREALQQAARTQLAELTAASEKMIAALGEGLKDVQKQIGEMEGGNQKAMADQVSALRQEREAMEKATADQVAKLSQASQDMVAALTDSQQRVVEQMAKLAEVMQQADKLGAMQEALSSNLQILATSDAFRETLSGIDRGLNHLNPVLKDLSQRAGIDWTETDGRRGGISRLWRRSKK